MICKNSILESVVHVLIRFLYNDQQLISQAKAAIDITIITCHQIHYGT